MRVVDGALQVQICSLILIRWHGTMGQFSLKFDSGCLNAVEVANISFLDSEQQAGTGSDNKSVVEKRDQPAKSKKKENVRSKDQ